MIKEDRQTISSLLGNHGYRTGIVGKWHLGLGWPTEEGVDVPKGRTRMNPDRIKWDKQLTDGAHRLFDYSYIIPASLNMPPFVYIENGRWGRSNECEFTGFIRVLEGLYQISRHENAVHWTVHFLVNPR